MKNIITILVLFSILVGFGFGAEGEKYGKALTLKDTTKISSILENPESYVGKRVLVKGAIVDVCEKRGCWMMIAGDKPFETIRIKVKDGEIVFPMTAKGKTALAEGEFMKIVLTLEQTKAAKKHEAEEHGTEYDESKITEPETIYQIKGFGAVILND